MNKRSIIILASSIIGVLVLLLLILWLLSIFGHRYLSYEQVEDKIVKATTEFYKAHPEILPTVDGKSTLAYNTLVENKYIDPLEKILKDGDSCYAEVNVIKNGNDYNYIPRLTCGDKYATRALYEQVIANNDVVESGSGLYLSETGEYYFRGKNLNNYVLLGTTSKKKTDNDLLWQIISIKDNQIKMRATFRTDKTVFDNRYNVDRKNESGYNTFQDSVIQDFLIAQEKDNVILSPEQKAKLVKTSLCVAPRSLEDPSKDGSTECSIMTEEKYLFGVATPYEYMRASLDEKCTSTDSRSCENLNFLSDNDSYSSTWTLTGNTATSYEVYAFDGSEIMPTSARNNKSLYLTATISEYTLYKTGDGSITNPYRLFKTK